VRDIKFRVYDMVNKKFIKESNGSFDSLERLWIRLEGGLSSVNYYNARLDNFVLQQYTGLKDKNGKEIYEGDIVERRRERGLVDFNDNNYDGVLGWNLLLYQYMSYDKEGWIYQEKEDGQLPAIEYYYGRSPSESWEVVGNIFEGVDK